MEKPEWFKARTPTGTVPVLEHDDGRVLYESLVICDYLDAIYPQNRLWPTDPFEKARQQIMIETYSKVTTAFYKLIRKAEWAVDDLNNSLEYFENNLNADFFAGKI
jgi:glutathione S-transferase